LDDGSDSGELAINFLAWRTNLRWSRNGFDTPRQAACLRSKRLTAQPSPRTNN
jgi:hypothetical protein